MDGMHIDILIPKILKGGGREYGMEGGREVIKHLHGVANPLRVKRISNFLDILVAYWWIFI